MCTILIANNNDALCSASYDGHLEIVKLLLKNKADVHAKDDGALRFAAKSGHLEIVKLLLENGADVHADDNAALRYSLANGHLEVVRLLCISRLYLQYASKICSFRKC